MIAVIDRLAASLLATIAAVVVLAAAAVAVGVAFRLTVAGSIGLYFTLWWTLLFAILPVRMRSQIESGEVTPGTEPGAPASPALHERAIWTSIATTLVFWMVAAFFPLAGL